MLNMISNGENVQNIDIEREMFVFKMNLGTRIGAIQIEKTQKLYSEWQEKTVSWSKWIGNSL